MTRDREKTTGVPRWVKVLLIVVAIVALLIVAMLLLGIGGEHGPSRHGGLAPPSAILGER